MEMVRQRARFDWLVELGGASAFGIGCAYAALKLAPSFAIAAPVAMTGAGLSFFALGMVVMRVAPTRPAEHRLVDFPVAPLDSDELLLTDALEEPLLLDRTVEPNELLLDTTVEEPLLLDTPYEEPVEDDVLLLENPRLQADQASRVVRLFAQPPSDATPPQSDAARELYEALSKLRRSLR